MSELPAIEMHKETVEISGDRKLYRYDFIIDGELSKPMSIADVVAPAVTEADAKPAG